MNVEAFENLELIPKLLATIESMDARLKKFAPPLTTKQEVSKFLGKSERTVNNYITTGLLREGYHFHRKNVKILVFVEDAIIEFRDELHRGIAYEKVAV